MFNRILQSLLLVLLIILIYTCSVKLHKEFDVSEKWLPKINNIYRTLVRIFGNPNNLDVSVTGGAIWSNKLIDKIMLFNVEEHPVTVNLTIILFNGVKNTHIPEEAIYKRVKTIVKETNAMIITQRLNISKFIKKIMVKVNNYEEIIYTVYKIMNIAEKGWCENKSLNKCEKYITHRLAHPV